MRQDNRSSTGGFRRRFSERREGVDARRQGPQERGGSKNGVLMVALIRSNGVPHKTPAKAAGVEFDQCGERPPTWCTPIRLEVIGSIWPMAAGAGTSVRPRASI